MAAILGLPRAAAMVALAGTQAAILRHRDALRAGRLGAAGGQRAASTHSGEPMDRDELSRIMFLMSGITTDQWDAAHRTVDGVQEAAVYMLAAGKV